MRRDLTAAALAAALVLLPITSASAEEVPVEEIPTAEPTETPSTPEPSPAPVEPAPEAPVEPAPEAPEIALAADEAEEPEETTEAGQYTIDSAELRWGVNDESNARAFAPGTFNVLSAGKVGDPGAGAQTLTNASQGRTWSNGRSAGWSASSGSVTLEKSNGSSYQRATWAGLSTDTSGASLGPAGGGTHSGHQLVFGDGTGEIDTEAGTATISWDGDATVLYYSGMSFFYVSDPELTVADGRGTVTATLGGFASSMEDMTQWAPLAPREVTIATLPSVELEPDGKGFTVTPDYRGVRLSNVSDQLTSGDHWGAFPESFVAFQQTAGAAQYWYSSGGSADKSKPAAPLTVSYDQGDPIVVDPPASGGGGDTVSNPIVQAPSLLGGGTAPSVLTPPSNLTVPAAATSDDLAPASGDGTFVQSASAQTLTAAELSAQTASRLWWWIGTVLLTLAAGSVAGTFAYSAAASRR